ncbi:MAG: ribonuclease HI family protein [Fimbriiglobus sp.]
MMATIHIDGGSRGNPGPASYAVYLERPGEPVVEECDKIGTATNNVAEYTALIRALELAQLLGLTSLRIYSDSELMVKQMKGVYKVKSADLQDLYAEAKKLRANFESVTLLHVPREANREADRLCNLALDGSPKPRAGEAVKSTKPTATKPVPKVSEAERLLRDAATTWATHGLEMLPVENVLQDLRQAILAEAGR